MPVSEGFSNMQEARDNLRIIKKCMSLLEANYSKKKEETIRVIQEAGYTYEEIKRIKERYCLGEVTLAEGYKNRDEIREIAEKLKAINERIIFDGNRSGAELSMATHAENRGSEKTPDVEYVEAEVVSAEEFEEMRRRQEAERKRRQEERETDEVLRMVNAHHRQRQEQFAYASAGVGAAARGRGEREQTFRRRMADMAREPRATTYGGDRSTYEQRRESSGRDYRTSETVRRERSSGRETGARVESRGSGSDGRRGTSERYSSQRKSKHGRHLPKKNLKNKPKTINNLLRRVAAGALAISFIAGAYAIHRGNEYKEDVANRIEYVDDIIDRGGTTEDYLTYCSIDFTEEELDRFLAVEEKIDSFEGKESTDLDGVEIILTAREFKEIYQDIVRERLEEGYENRIDDNEIRVVRERDDLDGKWGDYNEHGHVSEIGYMSHMGTKDIPEELRDSIIAAYGEQGIEKPTMTVDQLIYKLDNHQIDKAEASMLLSEMLDDAKELMTRQYERVEEYGEELKEKDSTYTTIKEREEEQAKIAGDNKNISTASHIVEDDEIDR